MKLDRLQEYFTVFCVTAAGVLMGVYCGQLAGHGDTRRLGYIAAGIAALLVCLGMRTRIWMLIPLAWEVKQQSYLLPLPFGVRDVFILLSFGTFLIYTALKLLRKKPKHDFLDLIMWINLIYLLSVYVRNPVGFNSLGNDMVGGKPYYLTIIAVLGNWVLSRVTLTVKQARTIPIMVLISVSVVGFLSLVAFRIPATVPVLSHIYSGVEQSSYSGELDQYTANTDQDPDSVSDRIASLLYFGLVAVYLLCAVYPPVSLLNPLLFWRFLLFVLAWISILYSGHRMGIILALSFVFVASYFHGGTLELFKLGAFFMPVFAILIFGHGTLFELPLVAQRALSFLPGKWDLAAVENAQASSEWRFEIWRRVLESNKYIKDKILGDGFGTSQKAQDEVMDMAYRQEDGAAMEGQMINGGFHSGPLTTIRVVGVVGGVLFYIWMIYLAYYAVRLINSSKNTPFFSTALFFGGTISFQPLFFTFVFGAFDGDLPQIILSTGMLKLIHESIQIYKASQNELDFARPDRLGKVSPNFAPVST